MLNILIILPEEKYKEAASSVLLLIYLVHTTEHPSVTAKLRSDGF
jgi:hypothetical protein